MVSPSSSSPNSVSLLDKYAGKDHKEGLYLFKNAGGGQTRFHITQRDSSRSLCGRYNANHQHHNNSFEPTELDSSFSLDEVKEMTGLGTGLCKNCRFKWKER